MAQTITPESRVNRSNSRGDAPAVEIRPIDWKAIDLAIESQEKMSDSKFVLAEKLKRLADITFRGLGMSPLSDADLIYRELDRHLKPAYGTLPKDTKSNVWLTVDKALDDL